MNVSDTTELIVADAEVPLLAISREVLQEFTDQRAMFRKWLFSHFKEGIHFGQPKPVVTRDRADGGKDYKTSKFVKDKDGGGSGKWVDEWVPFERYTPRYSLYKAGAELMVDLMKFSAEYSADMDSWQQMGSPKGTFVRKCVLRRKKNGEIVGEGTGIYKNGNYEDGNKAVKMADKRATVAAVLNACSISDLFTQDIEDQGDDKGGFEAPENAPDAAKPPKPRTDRVTKVQIEDLKKAWATMVRARGNDPQPGEFSIWVNGITRMPVGNVPDHNSWMFSDYDKCMKELRG